MLINTRRFVPTVSSSSVHLCTYSWLCPCVRPCVRDGNGSHMHALPDVLRPVTREHKILSG